MLPAKRRPEPSECPGYFQHYVDLVPGDDVQATLESGAEKSLSLYRSISKENSLLRYAPGKWTIREVLGHVTDSERIFTYRALCIARGDQTPLPGFDENVFVQSANFNAHEWGELIEQFALVRKNTVSLLRSFWDEAWDRRGNANGLIVTVRAIAWLIAGHDLHHRQIVETRYIPR